MKFAEKEIQFCEKNNIRILLRYFNELPHLLNECDDSPAILYQKGNFDDSLQKISIVGTRNMTSYGQQFIGDFLEAASSSKCISVSGLALGVDKEVHEQSIHYKIPTVAVLAHGFHMLYPSKIKSSPKRFWKKAALCSPNSIHPESPTAKISFKETEL